MNKLLNYFYVTVFMVSIFGCISDKGKKGKFAKSSKEKAVSLPIGPNIIKNSDFHEGLKYWSISSRCPNDSKFSVQGNSLKISRKTNGYFLRAYQDIIPKPDAFYTVSYKVKLKKYSRASMYLIFQNKDKKWLDKKIIYIRANKKRFGKWVTVKRNIWVPGDIIKIRVDLDVKGNSASAEFKDISFRLLANGRKQNNNIIPLLSGDINIDGKLNEALWKYALTLDKFRVLGYPNRIAAVQTIVKVLVNNNNLIIGAEMYEPDKENLENYIQNVQCFYAGNCFEAFLSSDRKRYLHVAINPGGLKTSEIKGVDSYCIRYWYDKNTLSVPGVWNARVTRGEKKWVCEISIPLKEIFRHNRLSKTITHFYANFCRERLISPKKECSPRECSNWAGLPGKTFHIPEQFPEFTFSSPIAIENIGKKKSKTDKLINLSFSKQLEPSNILFAGEPIKVLMTGEYRPSPGKLLFSDGAGCVDSSLKKQLNRWICIKGNPVQIVKFAELRREDISEAKDSKFFERMKSKEAFKLKIGKDKIEIRGNSKRAFLNALSTLALIAINEHYKGNKLLPCLTVWDAPGFKIRGWQVGVHDFHRFKRLKSLVDTLFLLRCNTMIFQVSSYANTVPFPFETIPEISNGKFTKKDWRQFADYVRSRGINPIPLFYSWSRAGFILNRKKYAHLAERPDLRAGVHTKRRHDRNFCAVNPESYKLLFKLFAEIIDCMKITDLHIGHDELYCDAVSESKLAVERKRTKLDWILDTTIKTAAFLKKRNVRLWIYGDCLNPNANGWLFGITSFKDFKKFDSLPKDIVIQDWRYRPGKHTSVIKFKEAGYHVVSSCWKSIPGLSDLIKYTYMARADGHIGTSWCEAYRTEILPEVATTMALGTYLSWSPQNYDLSKISFVPVILYQRAAYPDIQPIRFTTSLVCKTPDNALSWKDMVKCLVFPQKSFPAFLKCRINLPNGVNVVPFSQNGNPAAVIIGGKQKMSCTIKINKKTYAIALLHTLSKQNLTLSKQNLQAMDDMFVKFRDKSPLNLIINYTDGTTVKTPLTIRYTVTFWNDPYGAKDAVPALFGTLSGMLHVNIPLYIWKNPHPSKTIDSLKFTLASGSHSFSYALLGMSLLDRR